MSTAPLPGRLRWLCDVDTDSVDAEIALQLTGDSTLEREVHDCQRLIADGRYGPLVAVFPFKPAMALDDTAFIRWTRVATVWNWGTGDSRNGRYDALEIEEDLNCLFLRIANGRWEARMTGRLCSPSHSGTSLPVVAQQYQGPDLVSAEETYPPTARFRWNRQRGTYSIGVKCGDNWCTVGRGADPPQPLNGALLRTVPGYFDEQPLAVYDSIAKTLRIGPLGRIYPTDQLRRANAASALAVWEDLEHHATIEVLRGANTAFFEAYIGKFGLELAADGRSAGGEIHLSAPASGPPQAEIRTRLGAKPAFIVDVVENRRHSAESTVRWRWLEQDEAAWLPCKDDDCCTGVWR